MCRIAVALALFLLGVYAVAPVGTDLLQPPIYHSHKANGGGNLKQRSIIGGLLKRQYCNPGYGYCSNSGRCCPLGDGCCNTGKSSNRDDIRLDE
ncbi:hypothetical protein M378DRAFT_166867 [Amanita muscaria Koide BX008]|uniref:Uncharacterized protein n=1 Tax=Amanita muscaria (strain Koide BX008) TaxID=946122 RepID=A0A0C2WIR3_AMAMK|nr:hypothetical protein M378DRAFT_166867 [Amanita muscaria Koide BX008]